MTTPTPDWAAYYGRFARAPDAPFDAAAPREPFAIVVPYRDDGSGLRAAQLDRFVAALGPRLTAIEVAAEIIVVEQSADGRRFNRGRLLNVGARLAAARGARRIVLHDVDLLPDDALFAAYGRAVPHAVHLAAGWAKYAHLDLFFGGVVELPIALWTAANGYPNDFWGWGGEDEALYHRLVEQGAAVARPPAGAVIEQPHPPTQADPARVNHDRFAQIERRPPGGVGDGLDTLAVHHQGPLTPLGPAAVICRVELEPPASAAGRAHPPAAAAIPPPLVMDPAAWTPGATRPAGDEITFYLNVFRDADLLGPCLDSVRAAYPDAAIIVRSDGDDDPRITRLARAAGARFIDDIGRYTLGRGGEYVQVMLDAWRRAPTRWLFKIDPDTRVERPFEALPRGACLFGTVQRQRPLYSIQGGCIGFTADALEQLDAAAIFRDPRLAWMPPPYLTGSAYLRAHLERGLMAEDWMIGWAAGQRALPLVDWPEILSEWRLPPPGPPGRYAVTHPHKPTAADVDVFTCALRHLPPEPTP